MHISEILEAKDKTPSLGQLSSVEPAQVKAKFADLLALQISLLDWNRAQPTPPITQGYEYGVAAAVYGMLQQGKVGTSAPGLAPMCRLNNAYTFGK